MANIVGEAISALRASPPKKYAAQLCAVSKDPRIGPGAFTDALLQATQSGSLSIDVLGSWLSITRDVPSMVRCLRQQESQEACGVAVCSFARALQHDSTFDAAWDAVGGTTGLVALMDTLSVQQVNHLCRQIARKPHPTPTRQKLQHACRDLLAGLCPEDAREAVATNKRPLQEAYHPLVLACDPDTALLWDDRIGLRLRKHLRSVHAEAFLQKTVDACFPASAATTVRKDDFGCLQALLQENRLRYGLVALARLAESERIPEGLQGGELVRGLIVPVINREPRDGGRRIRRETSASLWKAVTACFEKHPALRSHLGSLQDKPSSSSVIPRLVRDWGRFDGDADHEASLVTLLRLLSDYDSIKAEPDYLLRRAPRELRYRLLRLFCEHAYGFGLDLGRLDESAPPIAKTDAQRLRVTIQTFVLLPPSEARLLAQRLLAADADLAWIASDWRNQAKGRWGPLHWNRGLHEYEPDPYILQAMLQSVTGATGGPDVAEELSRRKRAAQVSKEPGEREFWAKSAIFLAMSRGSLASYGATLKWSKRFANDWLVYRVLFAPGVVGADESVDLLSVVPPRQLLAFRHFDPAAFAAAVKKGNEIIAYCVQQAMDATREQSFSVHDWRSVFSLMTDVVYRRLALVNDWQDHFKITDAQITDLLWTPTFDTIIGAEKQLLDFGNKDLCSLAREGLYSKSDTNLGALRAPSLLFLDSLAKARNGLWEDYRVQLDQRVASLDVPWPRGLPLHETVRFLADAPFELPHMEKRARSIVFGSADAYLSPIDELDNDTKEAISDYVEDWPTALNIYFRGTKGNERKRRIESAWDHASGPLTKRRRLSKRQARSFWEPYFQEASAAIPKSDDANVDTMRILPSSDFPLSSPPSPWNPLSLASFLPAPGRYGRLEGVCLDALLDNCCPDQVSYTTLPSVTGPQLYWDMVTSQDQKNQVPQPAVDSHIATAALALNTLYGAAPLLAKPFPSSDPAAIRFPAMDLDPTFVKYDSTAASAKSVLKKYARPCPAALLTRLAYSLLDGVLHKTADEEVGYVANECLQSFVFVFGLLKAKKSALAGELAVKAIVDLSSDSSWHRNVLTVGLLRRLPPSEAEKTMRGLLDGLVRRRLKFVEAADASKATTQAIDATGAAVAAEATEKKRPRKAFPIKTTTVKMVAQVLNNSPVVSVDYAVDVLTRLFSVSGHVDVYVEAAQNLIRTVGALPDSAAALQQQVIQALATYVVPRAGSLDEQQQKRSPTEENWRSIEEGNAPMPELWDNQREGNPVLLDVLMRACGKSLRSGWRHTPDNPPHPRLHSALVSLLEAALRENGRLHRRWMQAFIVREKLASWSPEIDALLPAVPVYFENMFASIVDSGLITAELFEAMKQHVLQIIEPPSALADITALVEDDTLLRQSPAGKHWLRMWKKREDTSVFRMLGGRWAADTLVCMKSTPDVLLSDGVDTVADFVREMGFAFLRTGDTASLGRLTDVLVCGAQDTSPTDDASTHRGRGKGQTLLQQLANRSNRMRNHPLWRQNPNRRPATLPDAFEWKFTIWQCGVPSELPGVVLEDSVLSSLVDGAVQLVKELVEEDPSVPYHGRFATLKEWFRTKGLHRNSRPMPFTMKLALALGSIDAARYQVQEGGLVHCLCADLSCAYLVAARREKQTTATGVKSSWGKSTALVEALVDMWRRSNVDFLWTRAEEVISQAERQAAGAIADDAMDWSWDGDSE